jgi:urease beta subunit
MAVIYHRVVVAGIGIEDIPSGTTITYSRTAPGDIPKAELVKGAWKMTVTGYNWQIVKLEK